MIFDYTIQIRIIDNLQCNGESEERETQIMFFKDFVNSPRVVYELMSLGMEFQIKGNCD